MTGSYLRSTETIEGFNQSFPNIDFRFVGLHPSILQW